MGLKNITKFHVMRHDGQFINNLGTFCLVSVRKKSSFTLNAVADLPRKKIGRAPMWNFFFNFMGFLRTYWVGAFPGPKKS